jgi:hypothetical protein
MSGELAVFNILSTNTTFNSNVGGATSYRIFYDEADQTTVLPFTIVSADSIQPNDTKDGVSTLDFDLINVTHFADTKKKANKMAVDSRGALDRITGTYNAINVESIQFQTQRSGSEYLVDKKVYTVEQLYQVMTK